MKVGYTPKRTKDACRGLRQFGTTRVRGKSAREGRERRDQDQGARVACIHIGRPPRAVREIGENAGEQR